MLKTMQERIELLKAHIDYKTIEKLYLTKNNFKIVHIPLFFELLEINIESSDYI